MTQDEIIRMAQEAGFALLCSEKVRTRIERFAALVAAHEREACAKVCLETDVHPDHGEAAGDFLAGHIWGCEDCAAAIRARGE